MWKAKVIKAEDVVFEDRVGQDPVKTRFARIVMGSASRKRRRTFSLSLATLLSYPLCGRLAPQAIEPTENTAPPPGVSKNVISARISGF